MMEQLSNLGKFMPGDLQKELRQQRNKMYRIAGLAIQALDQESEVYSYTVFKALSTIETLDLVKRASVSAESNPELEAWFDQNIHNYLAEMEKVPQEICEKIFRQLKELSPEHISDGGVLEELVANFVRRLTG